MKNLSLPSINIFKPIRAAFSRFHMTIFIVLVTAGLSVAVIFLNNVINDPSVADNYTSPIDAGSIDQSTLDRIKALHTSDEKPTPADLPTGRINPFVE